MKFGKLSFEPASEHLDLVARPVAEALEAHGNDDIYVAPIDASLADTAAFCKYYDIGLDMSANCVILEAKRADRTWYVAVVVLATMRADVNGIIRRHLDARKISFAPMDTAIKLTGMEYGGITPIGLPSDWTILIDENVAKADRVIIGSGLRGSKILLPGNQLKLLNKSELLELVRPFAE